MAQRKVDHNRMLADARTIRENISRARGYLRRDDFYRCIEAANDALVLKSTSSALGMGRSEVDLLFVEMCDDFSRHPRVIAFLESIGVSGGPFLRYKKTPISTLRQRPRPSFSWQACRARAKPRHRASSPCC